MTGATIGRENVIENAIIEHPELLGFPGASAIRNWAVAPAGGRLDLGLFPVSGPVRLVLIEAKAAAAQDATSKVVGQLMMYYAGALMLGSEGLDLIRNVAIQDRSLATSTTRKSHVKLCGGKLSSPEAWTRLCAGRPVMPEELRMFVGLDNEPHPALERTLALLREQHNLPIGLVVVRGGSVARVSPKPAG